MRFAASKGTPDFSPGSLSSLRTTSNAGSAAGAVSVGNIQSAIKAKSPKMDQIGSTVADVDSAKKIAYMESEAAATQAGIGAYGNAIQKKSEVDMYNKMASKAGSGGTMGLFGGIAGGALSLATGGIA